MYERKGNSAPFEHLKNKKLRESIVKLKKKYPCMTLRAIGDKVGVSYERVRQILNENHIPTKQYIAKNICLNCGAEISRHRTYCNMKCLNEFHNVLVECACGCGELFRRRIAYINRSLTDSRYTTKRYYKNKEHYGRVVGKKYGFGACPEHSGRHKKDK